MNPCATPTPRSDADGDDRWLSIHNRFLAEAKEKDPDIIFMGDCIMEHMHWSQCWQVFFSPLHSLNFSIRDDRTENILWRIENGELDHVKPKILVLHVGTNNVDNSPEEIAEGILQIVQKIRSKLPDVYIVLPTILPRGQLPNKLREKNSQVNGLVKEKVIGLNRVQTVSIEKGLVQGDGTISHHDMFDFKNLTEGTTKKVFEPIHDLLTQILNENEQEKDLTPSE